MRRTILPAIAAGVMMLSALNQTEVTAKTLKDGEVKAEQVWQDSGQQVYTKEPRCGDRVTLSFAGDISFAEGYANMSYYHSNGNDITKCITPEVIARMDRADIMMVQQPGQASFWQDLYVSGQAGDGRQPVADIGGHRIPGQ